MGTILFNFFVNENANDYDEDEFRIGYDLRYFLHSFRFICCSSYELSLTGEWVELLDRCNVNDIIMVSEF